MTDFEKIGMKTEIARLKEEVRKANNDRALMGNALEEHLKREDSLHEDRKRQSELITNLNESIIGLKDERDTLKNTVDDLEYELDERIREMENQSNENYEVSAVWMDPVGVGGKIVKNYIVNAPSAEEAAAMIERMNEEETEAGEPAFSPDCQIMVSPLDFVNGIVEV